LLSSGKNASPEVPPAPLLSPTGRPERVIRAQPVTGRSAPAAAGSSGPFIETPGMHERPDVWIVNLTGVGMVLLLEGSFGERRYQFGSEGFYQSLAPGTYRYQLYRAGRPTPDLWGLAQFRRRKAYEVTVILAPGVPHREDLGDLER